MSKPKVKVKIKKGKGKSAPVKVKAKVEKRMYIGGEAAREKARADSLQRELNSLKCQIKVIIKEQQ